MKKRILWITVTVILILAVGLSLAAKPIYQLYIRHLIDSGHYSDAEATVRSFALDHDISFSEYPEEILALLERNPETEEFVLHYPLEYDKEPNIDLSAYENSDTVPLFLQWDRQWGYIEYGSNVAGLTACGPVCLAMAGYYLTGDARFSPDKVMQFAMDNGYYAPGSGSSWSLISEGGWKLGLDITEIPLDENRIIRNLEVDNPIICVMGPGDFTTTGHFIVMTGYENGMIRINDPNSVENSEKLWAYEDIYDQIKNLWVIRAIG